MLYDKNFMCLHQREETPKVEEISSKTCSWDALKYAAVGHLLFTYITINCFRAIWHHFYRMVLSCCVLRYGVIMLRS